MKRGHGAAFATVAKPAVKKVKPQGDYQKGRELSRAPPTELKAFDTPLFASNFTAAGVFTCLNLPVNGPELYQRVGRKIYMKSIQIRGTVENILTTNVDIGRIIVFYDSQPNGAAPTLATLLQDSNAAAATSVLSEINLANRQRFKILRDYQLALPPCTNVAGAVTNQTIQDPINNSFNIEGKHWFVKLKGLETIYNATNGGTIADINSGAIWIVTFSTINNAYSLNCHARLRYYD